MDKVAYENVEQYVIDQLTKHHIQLEYKGYTIRPKSNDLSESKSLRFESSAGTMLSMSVMEEGYLTIGLSSKVVENKVFFFDMYLEKFDQDAYRDYWDMSKAARKSNYFFHILSSDLTYFLNYLDQSTDLQAVLNGEKWFHIPFDFGGMK